MFLCTTEEMRCLSLFKYSLQKNHACCAVKCLGDLFLKKRPALHNILRRFRFYSM